MFTFHFLNMFTGLGIFGMRTHEASSIIALSLVERKLQRFQDVFNSSDSLHLDRWPVSRMSHPS